MTYETPITDKAFIPLFIVNRVSERLYREWPHLSTQIDDLKPGDTVTITFSFKIKIVARAYDEKGRIIQKFIQITPGWTE